MNCLPRSRLAEAIDDILRRIQRAVRCGHAMVEDFAQRRPGPGLRWRQSIHFGEVPVVYDDPEVGIENAETVRCAFDRRVQQNLRLRKH